MHPFVISELTENKWAFKQNGGEFHPPIAADKISILTQNDIADGSSVEKWLSVWTNWADWTPSATLYHASSLRASSTLKPDLTFGSKLPTRERTCQSTNNFYCIGAGEEKNWIQRQKCPGPCGDLTDKDENCLQMPRDTDEADSKWLKTKCVSSLKVPTRGKHACPSGSTLPVPMTKSQLQAWLSGYEKCDFEFHSDKAKLPVGLSAENGQFISLLDGAKGQHDFNINSILDGGWKKGITECYNILKKKTAGLNEEKCGQKGYCCSGSGKNNGEHHEPRYHNDIDHVCPPDAVTFIDNNNLQSRHHCLRQGA